MKLIRFVSAMLGLETLGPPGAVGRYVFRPIVAVLWVVVAVATGYLLVY